MAGNQTKEVDTKLYEIKRKNVYPYIGKITVFILNHENNRQIADNIEKELKGSNIEFKRDVLEFTSCYENKVNVFDEVKYMVVLVSGDILRDWALMGILLDNYDLKGDNSNIIPIIVENALYDPMEKSRIVKALQEYSKKYVNECYIQDYDDGVPEELERIQRIITMVKDFLNFSLKKDKKSDQPYFRKIVKYIKLDTGIDLESEKNIMDDEGARMGKPSAITNNFYGDINGMQIQQGNEKAKQSQILGQPDVDYEKVQRIVEQIRKYDDKLDLEYGESAVKAREILTEVASLAEQKKEPGKIKNALLALKDLSIGITGSLIASGIVSVISGLNI